MERIYTLIDKLYQQKNTQASPAHLLFTVQLLQQELSQLQQKNGSIGTKKVAVTLPVTLNFSEEALRTPYSEVNKEKEIFVLDAVPQEIDEEEEEQGILPLNDVTKKEPYTLPRPAVQQTLYTEPPVEKKEETKSYSTREIYNSAFENVSEAPTLTQYGGRKEVHHALGDNQQSLNDRLKDDKTEVAHRLKDSPIKDLRKGVGINDRFVFVKELFRGDEAMYERSIKTINNYNILSEAEYWIARELKHKLGWDDNNATVQHFYQLVKRRFS